ncbi:M14 family metallopeptidase [Alicyclobacillus sendaiensis]|uniref:M14 family metallopeptidase n=1 Tax=Alicyclobacillus sendaiensis TaxID=192387 RepID=UPI000A993382|nr:M14 family metallopeptidase [Alicyclobacillus sendaiensis]
MPTAAYMTYAQLVHRLHQLADRAPDLVRVEIMGKSREGRDLLAVTVTDLATGSPLDKPALLVDGNIHAGEVCASSAVVYWLECLVEARDSDPAVRELLRTRTVYAIPRIAVDGAELYLTTPVRLRSSPHLYPHTSPPDGFVEDDVNGDGRILWMRVPAEDGAYAVDEIDPRLMRPRQPGEVGGAYYHLFPEGRIARRAQGGTRPAVSSAHEVRLHGMDFNRNFPIRWAGESGQPGAGPFPLSEPELRALADFIQAHPNIAAYAALHTSGGVILRQPSTGDDTVLSPLDRALFTEVARMGERETGYFSGSNYEKFATGHETVLMPGAADDWMYDHLGVLSFTVELWDLRRRAGARGYGEIGMRKMLALTAEERLEDERKVIDYVAREFPEAYTPWTPFDHPDFGRVEIGGMDPKFVVQNPPPALLEEECDRVARFLTRLGLSTARLVVAGLSVEPVAEGVYRVVAEVANAGFLPTTSTKKGRDLALGGIRAELHGASEVLAGTSPCELCHLDGYGFHGAWRLPVHQRAHVEWVIRGAPGDLVEVQFHAPRAGRAAASAALP